MDEIISANQPDQIWYLSDLHFDYGKISKAKYANLTSDFIQQREDNFINFVKKYPKVLFVLAGDFYDNYDKSLKFIQRLDHAHVRSVVVLGNHDYWSKGKLTYADVLNYAHEVTKNNQYTHLLYLGKIIQMGSLTIIGDSAFTNFKYHFKSTDKHSSKYKQSQIKTATIDRFMRISGGPGDKLAIPELLYPQVKNWNISEIQTYNQIWINFVNEQVKSKKNLLVVTHWPLHEQQRANTASDTWFNYPSGLMNTQHFWSIFGHTHFDRRAHNTNFVSNQLGYMSENNDFSKISTDWFGKLIKYNGNRDIQLSNHSLEKYIDLGYITDPSSQKMDIQKVEAIGYKRAANFVNKEILDLYYKSPTEYLKQVAKAIGEPQRTISDYYDIASMKINDARQTALQALKVVQAGYQHNPLNFFTALFITGYAYSNQLFFLESMRPISIYDIAREYLVISTVQQFHLKFSEIKKIHKTSNKLNSVSIANLSIPLPVVNNFELKHTDLQDVLNDINLQVKAIPAHSHKTTDDNKKNQKETFSNSLRDQWKSAKIVDPIIGQIVHHRNYGIGKIISFDTNDPELFTVQFEKKSIQLTKNAALLSQHIPKNY